MDTEDLFHFKKLSEARLRSLENDAKRAFLPMADVAYAPFPIVMYSFATVDYFSSFWAGWNDRRNRPDSDKRSQTKRMADFLEKYLTYPQRESQLAITIWRHKLMHTAEPRKLASEDGKTLYWWSISDHDQRHWELVAEANGTFVLQIGVFNLIHDLNDGIMGPSGYFEELKGSSTLQCLCKQAMKELSGYTFKLES